MLQIFQKTLFLLSCCWTLATMTVSAQATYDFSNSENAAGWTIVDGQNDGLTWAWSADLGGMAYRGDIASSGADDWLISPAVSVKSGQNFYLTMELEQRAAFDADVLEIYADPAMDVTEFSHRLSTENIAFSNGNGTYTKTLRYEATATEDVHFAFHLTTPDANGSLTLKKVVLKETFDQRPAAVTGLTGSCENGYITLSWTNPTTDMNGVELTKPIDLIFTEDGETVGTLSQLLPGVQGTFSYAPLKKSGNVLISVISSIDNHYGGDATLTLNLDDITGEEELVATFLCNSSDAVAKWKLIDNGGAGAMKYDLGTIWLQHKLGKAYEENDWAISPAVKLQADERYLVRYEVATKRDYGATFDVSIGQGATIAAQSQLLDHQELLKQNGKGEFSTKQFSVAEDGSYNIGFHVTYVENDFSLYSASIYRINTKTGIDAFTPSPAATDIYDLQGRRISSPSRGLFIQNGKKVLK